MPQFQLPPLKNEKQFESFVCDLFNEIENTNTYQNTDFQTFGVSGQDQKGIDIFSPKTKTVIQCKVKDIRKDDAFTRNALLVDLDKDLYNAFQLSFKFERFILVSTFRDDAVIQEKASKITSDIAGSVIIYYWGWDSLITYAENYPSLLKKHFPKFFPKIKVPSNKVLNELPEGALGKDLDKKNYVSHLVKRYGDFKQIQFDYENKGEIFKHAIIYKMINTRYKASGINHVPVIYFHDLISFLKSKIDKTIIGKQNKSAGKRNYLEFGDNLKQAL